MNRLVSPYLSLIHSSFGIESYGIEPIANLEKWAKCHSVILSIYLFLISEE